MLEKEFHISKLLIARLKGSLNPAEEAELQEWLLKSEQYRKLMKGLDNDEQVSQKLADYESVNKTSIWKKTLSGLPDKEVPVKIERKFKLNVFAGAIAAAIALVVLGTYFYNTFGYPGKARSPEFVNGTKDIAPGKMGATLTLTDGKKINLTDVSSAELAKEAGLQISKTKNGELIYAVYPSLSTSNLKEGNHTLSTARGQSYQLRLPDGTLVFLNAESSLSYPISFAKMEKRQVYLTGEGYFEVAKDKTHPFIVKSNGQEVQVLGTHFNINSYADELVTKTTLLEGSVAISSLRSGISSSLRGGTLKQSTHEARIVSQARNDGLTHNDVTLRPGEQGVLSAGELKVQQVDVQAAVAWKNNEFVFESQSIQNIMKLVQRWYDVEVVYEDNLPDFKFNGGISRFDNVSKVLQVLESTKKVHFKVEGRRITVSK